MKFWNVSSLVLFYGDESRTCTQNTSKKIVAFEMSNSAEYWKYLGFDKVTNEEVSRRKNQNGDILNTIKKWSALRHLMSEVGSIATDCTC